MCPESGAAYLLVQVAAGISGAFPRGNYSDAAYIIFDGKADILGGSPKGVPRRWSPHGDLETLRPVEEWVFPPGHPSPQIGIGVMSGLATALHRTSQC
jgi:hypothetical protein